jgi:hypothetical protein
VSWAGIEATAIVEDRSREYQRLSAECVSLARQASDAETRATLSISRRVGLTSPNVQNAMAAIADELKRLYKPPFSLPPHILALPRQLNANNVG